MASQRTIDSWGGRRASTAPLTASGHVPGTRLTPQQYSRAHQRARDDIRRWEKAQAYADSISPFGPRY